MALDFSILENSVLVCEFLDEKSLLKLVPEHIVSQFPAKYPYIVAGTNDEVGIGSLLFDINTNLKDVKVCWEPSDGWRGRASLFNNEGERVRYVSAESGCESFRDVLQSLLKKPAFYLW